MKAHTQQFKQELIKIGKQIDSKITYTENNEEVILHDELYAVTPMFEGNLLKSVMKQLNVESSVDIPLNTVINYKLGVLVGNSYEYLDYGNYVVYSSEKKEDTDTYEITCYDKMLYSMKDYEPIVGTYPMRIIDYLSALAQQIGLSLSNTGFYNDVLTLPTDLYKDLEYTYRDVLDEIAQATGSIIVINADDEIEVKYPTSSNDTINEDYFKNINVRFKEKYGPINSIVLSRAGESDNVFIKDYESIQENGLCEVKIVDNQIMNFNDRSDYLQGLLAALDGIEYYINDFNSLGILYYDVGDYYNAQIGENTYKCLMLNDEINVTLGIEEIIHTDMPEQSETDYTKADKTDRRINQTYIIVDKQNQTIESVVSNVSEQNNKISQVQQTVNELNSKISDIADITTQQESMNGRLDFEGINESEPIEIKIHPIGTNISYIYPRDNLYPSDLLYMTDRKIRFTNLKEYIQTLDTYYTTYKNYYSYDDVQDEYTLLEEGTDYDAGDTISGTVYENRYIDYELPDNLLIEPNSGIYDEFYLGYDEQICQVTKRCQYNADGSVSLLPIETINSYSFPSIYLTDGDYKIELLGYDYGYMSIRLMAQNIYTTQFATKAELTSSINQTAESITTNVSQTYETKQNAQINYSQINQTATGISSRVSSVEESKVGKNEVISEINQSSEAVTINANKIGLTANDVLNIISGNAINLTSKNLTIASNNFNVDKNGNMTCNNANITGGEFNVASSGQEVAKIKIYTENDSNFYSEITPSGLKRVSKGIEICGFGNNFDLISGGTKSTFLWLKSTADNLRSELHTDHLYFYRNNQNITRITTDSVSSPTITQTSKEEDKKNFEKMSDNALKILEQIDIYKYNLKNEKDTDKKHIGFVIGDNYKYSKEVTSKDNDGVDIYSFTSLCCKAIQEQQEQIEQLKKEIKELKGENNG